MSMAGNTPRDAITVDSDSDDAVAYDDFFFSSDIEDSLGAIQIDSYDPSLGQEGLTTDERVLGDSYSSYETCRREVLEVFPDISTDYVKQLYDIQVHSRNSFQQQEEVNAQILIEKILEKGTYPKERDRIKDLKRKRSQGNPDEEEAARWKNASMIDDRLQYSKIARLALIEAFQSVPIRFIESVFKEHSHFYGAYFAILEAERSHGSAAVPPYDKLRSKRGRVRTTSLILMDQLRQEGHDFDGLKQEIDCAFQRRKRDNEKRQISEDARKAEEAQEQEHRERGEVIECGCCFDDVTLLKVTHCNGNETHYFCIDCAERNASNDIGNSRYDLRCMDQSGCTATFSRDQRKRFLDDNMIEKLERIQQQDEIRKADLQNLSTCPFCDFAAICPPVEEDREFRCHNLECGEISCRHCKLKSHIPLTCEESKKEDGVSERRVIEEARTEALIRTCEKCKVRILKEDGCNKVICTSCKAVLCDYCGKDITKVMYNHFDGQGRAPPGLITDPGGKCPLYDYSPKRKDQQVDQAEKDAMLKVRAEHPELSEDDLRIKFAKSVQSPSQRRQGIHDPYVAGYGPPRAYHFGPMDGPGARPPHDPLVQPLDRLAVIDANRRAFQQHQEAARLANQNLQQQRQIAFQNRLRDEQGAIVHANQNHAKYRQAIQARHEEQLNHFRRQVEMDRPRREALGAQAQARSQQQSQAPIQGNIVENQEPDNRHALVAQAQINEVALQPDQTTQQEQRQRNPWADERYPMLDNIDFEGLWNPAVAPNNNPPAAPYRFEFW